MLVYRACERCLLCIFSDGDVCMRVSVCRVSERDLYVDGCVVYVRELFTL